MVELYRHGIGQLYFQNVRIDGRNMFIKLKLKFKQFY